MRRKVTGVQLKLMKQVALKKANGVFVHQNAKVKICSQLDSLLFILFNYVGRIINVLYLAKTHNQFMHIK
jgi:hypothetical protein